MSEEDAVSLGARGPSAWLKGLAGSICKRRLRTECRRASDTTPERAFWGTPIQNRASIVHSGWRAAFAPHRM